MDYCTFNYAFNRIVCLAFFCSFSLFLYSWLMEHFKIHIKTPNIREKKHVYSLFNEPRPSTPVTSWNVISIKIYLNFEYIARALQTNPAIKLNERNIFRFSLRVVFFVWLMKFRRIEWLDSFPPMISTKMTLINHDVTVSSPVFFSGSILNFYLNIHLAKTSIFSYI